MNGYDIVDSETCRICGDKAIWYNFGVLSCESCKAFFRRHAFLTKKLKCRFQGRCDISKVNRTRCRYCRLQKCLEFGMRKEWIMSDEQRKVRKEVRETNKVMVTQTRYIPVIQMTGQAQHVSAIYSVSQMYGTVCQSSDDQSIGERSVDTCSVKELSDFEDHSCGYSSEGSALSSSPVSASPLSESPTSPPEIVTEDKPDYALVPVSRPLTDYRNNFTEIEGRYLTELLVATESFKTQMGTVCSEAMNFNDAIQVLHQSKIIDVQRFVALPKKLMAFHGISGEDSLSLIQQGVIEMHYLRSVTRYFRDGTFQYMIAPTENDSSSTCLVPLDVIRQTKPYLYSATNNLFETFAAEWDSDFVILDLMSAILLFCPERAVDHQSISVKQRLYKNLLQRYLLLKYRSEEKAIDKYYRLMTALDLVRILEEKRRLNAKEENYRGVYGWTDCFTLLKLALNCYEMQNK